MEHASNEKATDLWGAAKELFNRGDFFECHDVLEEIWSETLDSDREFYQGLIHAAVCLHHFREGNLKGARKMCESAIIYLSPFAPLTRGLLVDLFLRDLQHCCAELLSATGSYPADISLQVDRLPQWHSTDEEQV